MYATGGRERHLVDEFGLQPSSATSTSSTNGSNQEPDVELRNPMTACRGQGALRRRGRRRSMRAAMVACSEAGTRDLSGVAREARVRHPASALEDASLGEIADDFLGEEGVAGGACRRPGAMSGVSRGVRDQAQLGGELPADSESLSGASLMNGCVPVYRSTAPRIIFGPVRDEQRRSHFGPPVGLTRQASIR